MLFCLQSRFWDFCSKFRRDNQKLYFLCKATRPLLPQLNTTTPTGIPKTSHERLNHRPNHRLHRRAAGSSPNARRRLHRTRHQEDAQTVRRTRQHDRTLPPNRQIQITTRQRSLGQLARPVHRHFHPDVRNQIFPRHRPSNPRPLTRRHPQGSQRTQPKRPTRRRTLPGISSPETPTRHHRDPLHPRPKSHLHPIHSQRPHHRLHPQRPEHRVTPTTSLDHSSRPPHSTAQ